MDLSNVLTMDADEAKAKAAEYREIKQPTEEDRRIAAIFMALAAGKQVIDLHQAVRDGGLDDNGHPRLAAMVAYRPWCYLMVPWNGRSVDFRSTNTGRRNSETITVGGLAGVKSEGSNFRSQVPIVPPACRKWGYRKMVVLWEVEEWAVAPRPPGDPILLKPLLGALYTVEASWDLTEVERMVLAQRP